MGGNVNLQDQIEQLKVDLTDSNLRATKIGAGNEDDVDLERDPNQQSLMTKDELEKQPGDKGEEDPQLGDRNKKFLLNELKQLKDQMFNKLKFFKSRTQGKKGSKRVKESEAN